MEKSVVSIICKYLNTNPYTPWVKEYKDQGFGTGSFIEYQDDIVILTCSHVTRDSLDIHIRYHPLDILIPAEIIKDSYELDLCLLSFNSKEIKKHCKPLKLAKSIKRGETITAVGYPQNADNYSVTEGIYSRLLVYNSSRGLYRHLAIQSDTLINPGNSGGPGLNAQGEIMGIFYASFTPAGYKETSMLEPLFSLQYFLKAKSHNVGCRYLPIKGRVLPNAYFMDFYGIPRDSGGFLVSEGSPDNVIQPHDVIMEIDEYPINADGKILFHEHKLPWWTYILYDSKKSLNITLQRNGKKMKLVYKYPEMQEAIISDFKGNAKLKYYFLAGFIFGVLNVNLVEYLIEHPNEPFFQPPTYFVKEGEEIVLLLKIFPTPCTEGYILNAPLQVMRMNDKPVKNLKQFYTAINSVESKFVHIDAGELELVIPREYIEKNKELSKTMIGVDEAVL